MIHSFTLTLRSCECDLTLLFLTVSSSAAGAVDTWLKDGRPVRTGLGLRQRRDDTRLTLTLERVRRVDQGTYRCQLTTADGLTVDSAAWTLLVHSEFLLTQTKGQFRQSGRNKFTLTHSTLKAH